MISLALVSEFCSITDEILTEGAFYEQQGHIIQVKKAWAMQVVPVTHVRPSKSKRMW
jgi:hypothetical protein